MNVTYRNLRQPSPNGPTPVLAGASGAPGSIRAAVGFAAIAAIFAIGCHPPPDRLALTRDSHVTMGSPLEIAVDAPDTPTLRGAIAEAFQAVDRLDRLMSTWHPNSDLVKLNAAAGDHPVPVDPDVLDALRLALEAGALTGGKFDVTFGVLSGLWRFDAQNQDDRIPDTAEVARRLPLIDFRQIDLDGSAGTAFLRHTGMSAHLGGIGKGYAVDRVAAILRLAGFTDFLVQFGGDMLVSGRHSGLPWVLGIRDPRGPAERIIASLALTDATFSTSGDYERFFIAGGQRYHHILDPDTGAPARGARSVTIVAKTAATADALSTGVFVMGPRDGMALVERLVDVDAVIVTDTNDVLVSSGLKDRVSLIAAPTDAP